MKTIVIQCGDLVINMSSDWQPVKLVKEGCKMVYFLSTGGSASGINMNHLKQAIREINEQRFAIVQPGQHQSRWCFLVAEADRKCQIGLILQSSRKTDLQTALMILYRYSSMKLKLEYHHEKKTNVCQLLLAKFFSQIENPLMDVSYFD